MEGSPNLFGLESKRKYIFPGVRCLLFIAWLNFYPNPCHAQRVKIDSLKNALPTLHGHSRVDCLNILSWIYSYLNVDTALSYQQKAIVEARQMTYLRGEAVSLNNKARIAGHQLRNFPLQEKVSLHVIQEYSALTDQRVLTEAYMNLALALFCQSLFDRAAEACKIAIVISEQAGDQKGVGECTAMMGSISFESGNYEKSFEHFNQSLKIFRGINDSYNTAIVLAKIGDLYRLAGDHNTALNFYRESLAYKKGLTLLWHPLVDLGDAYYSLEPYDSLNAENTYIQTIKSLTIKSNTSTLSTIRNAEKYIASKEYNQALILLKEDYKLSKKNNDTNYTMRLLLDMGRVYEGQNDFINAFHYTSELLHTAERSQAKQYIRDGYRLMYLLHDQLHRVDSAYIYFQKYTHMKDSVALDEFAKKLAIHTAMSEAEKTKVQMELLSKEKQIDEQKLQSESFIKNVLLGGICLLALLGFIVFRNTKLKQKNEAHQRDLIEKELSVQKLESEKTKGELQQRALELEMQALRAQMNPHFIFNSLNSINRFILQNNKEQASEYLTKFSRLVRLILQNSLLSLISLESELESLQLYLELEAVRFDYHFEYRVNVDNAVDISDVKVPPLIIQPYVENAIWHGLMHKEEKGNLQITIFEEENLLCCKITDDGIGRKNALELKSKLTPAYKSMGMRISSDRIAMLHKKNEKEIFVSIRDLMLADGNSRGTEVCLKMPLHYD